MHHATFCRALVPISFMPNINLPDRPICHPYHLIVLYNTTLYEQVSRLEREGCNEARVHLMDPTKVLKNKGIAELLFPRDSISR